MNKIEKLNLLNEIENCKKNINACKSAMDNIKKSLYQEQQLLIMYKNRLKK